MYTMYLSGELNFTTNETPHNGRPGKQTLQFNFVFFPIRISRVRLTNE